MPCNLNLLPSYPEFEESLDSEYWGVYIYSVPEFWIARVRVQR